MSVTLAEDKLSFHFLEQMRKRRIPLSEVEACLAREPQVSKLTNGDKRLVYTNLNGGKGRGFEVVTSMDGCLITCYRLHKPRRRKQQRRPKPPVVRHGKRFHGPRDWSEEE